jgi:hypothetical protein
MNADQEVIHASDALDILQSSALILGSGDASGSHTARRGRAPRQRTNHRTPGSRRSAKRAGPDDDPGELEPPGAQPQARRPDQGERLCMAPWCDRSRAGYKYCGDQSCAQRRSRESTRAHRRRTDEVQPNRERLAAWTKGLTQEEITDVERCVHDGRWRQVGCWWEARDESLPEIELLMRNFTSAEIDGSRVADHPAETRPFLNVNRHVAGYGFGAPDTRMPAGLLKRADSDEELRAARESAEALRAADYEEVPA